MSSSETTVVVKTAYGQADLETLVKAYEQQQKYKEGKIQWLQSEAGKEYNRKKAKEYYARHKAEVLAKRKAQYEQNPEKFLVSSRAYHARKRQEEQERLAKLEAEKNM
jgi:hypothetical protein